MRATLRRALLVGVAALYVLSIPWWASTQAAPAGEPRWLFGLPDWVAVAVGCYALAAVLNALAWLLADVPDAGSDEGP